ncbi:MAG: DNA circularization N-terminal domain-containing protein [Oscillospiraceae bacterium]|nr:DNA circularization N-terminal domain-containing protein [Oscillospiraceae bacterium]
MGNNMKFRMFQWPVNPERFGIRSVCEPEYKIDSDGDFAYTGIGPMCRVFTGGGVFCGDDAVEMFNALAVIMATRTGGELYHPVWGTATAVLTELQMTQESRPDYIEYAFTFRETDESGTIPRLPQHEE